MLARRLLGIAVQGVRRAGPRALVLDVVDAATAGELARRLGSVPLPEGVEVVPGAASVLLEAAGPLPYAVLDLSPAWDGTTGTAAVPRVVTIPVTWDGADLADVAARWSCSTAGVVRRLEDTPLTSAFCGFAPGFAYLAGLPAELSVPRLPAPRARVPAGSLAVADAWVGLYPRASPGGWRLLGRTEVPLFDAAASPPALLVPGTVVRLVGR